MCNHLKSALDKSSEQIAQNPTGARYSGFWLPAAMFAVGTLVHWQHRMCLLAGAAVALLASSLLNMSYHGQERGHGFR
jgi:hypothetical protein